MPKAFSLLSFVVPIPAVASTTASVNNLVWGKDPEELRKLNEQRLAELGVAKDVQARLFKNKRFSPSAQTRLIAALHAVKAKNCDDYVDAASEAEQEREALFFVEGAEMLQAFHAQTPVTGSSGTRARSWRSRRAARRRSWFLSTTSTGARPSPSGARGGPTRKRCFP